MPGEGEDGAKDDIFKEAGRRARAEDLSIRRMAEAMRLVSFRDYLASAVDRMPTILPAISASVGITLPEVLQRLRPTPTWPACAGRRSMPSIAKPLPSFVTLGRRWTATTGPADVYAHPMRIGRALLSDGAFDGAFANRVEVAVSGRWLEIAMRGAVFELATHEGSARLKLKGRLPELVLSSCVGRRLDTVVDLALLRDRGLIIESAGIVGTRTVLHFHVDGELVEFPWRN